MTYDEYKNKLVSMFAFYGFLATPLEDNEILECFNSETSLDVAYSLGCDVYAGYPFVLAKMLPFGVITNMRNENACKM